MVVVIVSAIVLGHLTRKFIDKRKKSKEDSSNK